MNTKPYNPFDYLQTDAEIRDFMQDAWADEDSQVFVVALSHWLSYHRLNHAQHNSK